MNSDALDRALGNQVSIPTLPAVIDRINRMMADPEVGLRDVGSAIAQDAPIATKVLRIANSAFYGLREKVVSTEHAASVLGLRVLKNIVLQASVMSKFAHLEGLDGFDLAATWRHSVAAGHLCQELTRASNAGFALAPDEFYSCGLLHDIGKVVLLENLGDAYLEIVAAASASGRSLHELELDRLGFDHAAVAARVAETWGLPEILVSAIGRHHDAPADLQREAPSAAVVALANGMAHELFEKECSDPESYLASLPLGPLGLQVRKVVNVVESVQEALAESDL